MSVVDRVEPGSHETAAADPRAGTAAPEGSSSHVQLKAGLRGLSSYAVQARAVAPDRASTLATPAAASSSGGSGARQPHLDRIQRAFGAPDAGEVQAKPQSDAAGRSHASSTAIQRKAVQREEPPVPPSPATEGVISNTLLDIWATNISSAKDLFDVSVKPEQKPPASGLGAAILAIGIDVAAMALFGPLAAAATNRGRQVFVELLNSGFKNGLNATASALKGEDETPQGPSDFSTTWANNQRAAVNAMRQQLVGHLSSGTVTSADLEALTAAVKGATMSAATASRTMLEQYTRALYYHSGDESFDAKGRMLIEAWLGTDTGYAPLESPKEITATIAGLDTAGLKKLKESFPNGINPLDAAMAFEVRFTLMEGTGRVDREGNEGYSKNTHSCYFNNGGKLQNADTQAKGWITSFWGGKIPTVANFGKSAPSGWSKSSAV